MTRRAFAVGLIITLAAAAAGGCDKSPTAPSAGNTPTQPVRLTALDVSGNRSLTAIGQTSQLTLMAGYSDGTTKDVSSLSQWSSEAPGVAAVSPSGLVTATGLGTTVISALYVADRPLTRMAHIVVTPPGTFMVSGRVFESGTDSIPDVRVRETVSGRSTMSRADGEYSLGGLTSARLSFEKEGYEPSVIDATPNSWDDVPLQRVIRIAAGETAATTLAPHDMNYAVSSDARCYPCRLIRVVSSRAGILQLRLTWSNARTPLTLWVDGRSFERTTGDSSVVADVPVVAGESLLYVGLNGSASPLLDDAPITLATTVK